MIYNAAVLHLPVDISTKIFVVWLNLRWVARLDSAFCNRDQRPTFTALAYGPLISYSVERKTPWEEWCALRGVPLTELYLTDTLACNELLRRKLLSFQKRSLRIVTVISQKHTAGYRAALLNLAEGCPNIREASIGTHGLILWDDCVAALAKRCQYLHTLSIGIFSLSTEGLANAFKHCTSLTRCILGGGEVEVALPREVAIRSLTWLDIRDCLVPESTMIAIGDNCSVLYKLQVFSSRTFRPRLHGVTDAGVRALLRGCPLLQDTDAEYAIDIDTELRVELIGRYSYTYLNFGRGWYGVTGEFAHGVLAVCPGLDTFDCSEQSWPTDATLAVCAKHCPLLAYLNISGCSQITSTGFVAFVRATHSLKTIVLYQCPQLRGEALQAASNISLVF
jgi:hypothetical protein